MQISGLATGVDWEDIVNQLMQLESTPLLHTRQQIGSVEQMKATWRNLGARLKTLQSAAAALSDLASSAPFKAQSSKEDVFIASVSDAAKAGRYDITVERLAQAHRIGSRAGVEGTFDVAGGGLLRLNYWIDGVEAAQPLEIAIEEGSDVDAVARVINQAMAQQRESLDDRTAFTGIHAQVIDGHLVLTREQAGSAQIDLSGSDQAVLAWLNLTDAGDPTRLNELQAAQSAVYTVNGITLTAESNQVAPVPGVTIDLLQADPGSTHTLTVALDRQAIEARINAFITAYNAVVGQIDSDSEAGGRLQGDSAARQLSASLRRRLGNVYIVDEKGLLLANIGIATSGRAATLSFDSSKFWQAYEENPEQATALLKAAMQELETYLDGFTGNRGVVAEKERLYDQQIDRLESRQQQIEWRLAKRREALMRQFNQLETLMARMQTQSNWLAGQIQLLGNNWRRN